MRLALAAVALASLIPLAAQAQTAAPFCMPAATAQAVAAAFQQGAAALALMQDAAAAEARQAQAVAAAREAQKAEDAKATPAPAAPKP